MDVKTKFWETLLVWERMVGGGRGAREGRHVTERQRSVRSFTYFIFFYLKPQLLGVITQLCLAEQVN